MCENHALKWSCYLCVGQKDTGLGLNESPEETFQDILGLNFRELQYYHKSHAKKQKVFLQKREEKENWEISSSAVAVKRKQIQENLERKQLDEITAKKT